MARVLVTGARRGIGLVTSIELARRGHHVIGSVRRIDQCDDLEALGAEAGVAIEPVVLDVSDPSSISAAARTLVATGPLDVVVNNAGITQVGPIETTDVDTMHNVFATNIIGPMLLAQAIVPSMREQGSGLFVTVTSVARHPRFTPPSFSNVYASSKAAAHCWAEGFNKEIAGFGLRSIAVELSSFETDMTEPDDFASSVVPADSPYAVVAAVQDESIRRAPRPPATDAAGAIADLIEQPSPPLHSVCPAELAAVITSATACSDEDYLTQCQATSGREWARAFRSSLS